MDNPTGKWIPLNLDASPHECRPSKQPQQKQPQAQEHLTLESIDQRLKKIEYTLFGK
jgi:hypothetical protein